MLRRALIFAVLLLGGATTAQATRPLPAPTLIAVYAYADWCPNCKLLSPRLSELRAEYAQKNVLFLTLDLTDSARIHQSILLAQATGLGDFLKAQGSAVGYVALLDATSKQEVARFTSADDVATLKSGFAAAYQ